VKTVMTGERRGVAMQPVSAVTWVPRGDLRANDYNPNHVAPPELELLAVSILEDGWTQPIVARLDGEIVDGFHRWTVAQRPEIAEMTEGLVPVSYLPEDLDAAQQRMATIRHNRARGQHGIVRMADIVTAIVEDLGITELELQRRLGMDKEEVRRLHDHGNMLTRHGDGEYGPAWTIEDGFTGEAEPQPEEESPLV
jgi:ParB-like chromosome segregation protein Spo0J